jgi:hypothetical protein
MTPLELRTLLAMIARNRNDAPGRQLLPSAPSLPELGDVFATLNAAEELLLRSMKPGVPYRVADIASRARLVPSMVATALASLTDKGLVARLPPKGKVVSNEDLFDSTFIRIGAASGDSAA